MNSILRALSARWQIIAVTTTACLLGGFWVVMSSAPRYMGHARVVIDYIRPDPLTGAIIPSETLDAYLAGQIRMLRDAQVVGPTAEALGWLNDPAVLTAYADRPASDTRDLIAWVADIMNPRIRIRMVEDSNIMEISYIGESPEISRAAADALRATYIQSNVQVRQEASRQSAEKVQASIERVRVELAELEALQARVEAETGVVLGSKGIDEASDQLRLKAKRPDAPVVLRGSNGTATAGRLAQLEAVIDREMASLGPNNPALTSMLRERDMLRSQAAAEESSVEGRAAAIIASSRASAALFESLKARVLSTREPALRLRLLQDQIDNRQNEFRQLTEALVELRSFQSTTISSISPIGEAFSDPEPVFPNKKLIFGGVAGLGLVIGSILACLSELMGRRVRTRRHLESASGAVVLVELQDARRALGVRSVQPRRLPEVSTPNPPDLAATA